MKTRRLASVVLPVLLVLLALPLLLGAAVSCGGSKKGDRAAAARSAEKGGSAAVQSSRGAWDAAGERAAAGDGETVDKGASAGKGASSRKSAAAQPEMEPYADEAGGFALFKPKGWEVAHQQYPNGHGLTVRDPAGGAMLTMSFLATEDRSNNSVAFAALALQNVRRNVPDIKLDWSRTTKDRARTVCEAHYTNDRGVAVRGRYYFLMNCPEARFFACEVPAADFARTQPVLLSILSNLSLLNPGAHAAGRNAGGARSGGGGAQGGSPAATEHHRLPDGSASLLTPPGWTVTGGKGACLTFSPDQGSGFAFSLADFWGPSTMPYFDSSRIPGALHYPYMMPVDALAIVMQKLGSRNIQIVNRGPCAELAQEAMARTGRPSDAEWGLLSYVSGKGVPSQAYFQAIGSRPMPSGQWGILFFGIWAPASRFDQDRPALEEVAGSYRINEQYAAQYIQNGLANLRRLMGETNRKMAETAESARESNLSVFQEKMRSGDYIDYKRTMTIRGEQEWVSEAEGGAIYKSDHWGLSREGEQVLEGEPFNYYNFNGENPRYNESMTPVDASREVYEKVYGTGP